MKLISIKQTLIGFTVFLIISLSSCGLADDTAPPGGLPDYMSFALTNSTGATVTTTPLSRGSTYGLDITPASGTTTSTADYTVTYTPTDAIIIDVTRTNSVDFTVDNTATTTVTITVTHRIASAISESITLNLVPQAPITTTFQIDVQKANVPNLILANPLTRKVLSPLGSLRGGATLVTRYITENGGTTIQNGTSWGTAWAATNLRNAIENITDATANRVYLVMVAGGTYKPTDDGNRNISFSMTNHVAIMGGFQTAGGWGRTGTTIFSGDIGTAGNADNSYNVFSHINMSLENAHLYGVTITNGNANGGNTAQRSGGGMYNANNSSPVLTEVVFSGNIATDFGGGMYNANNSSPVLTRVVFSNNTANFGGGMRNISTSSPVLTEVVFSGNTAGRGGGMYNANFSSPVLTSVVFNGNTTTAGGGMYNDNLSSPVLTEVVFSGNTATGTLGGGGMYNNLSSPVLTKVVFSGNTATGTLGGGGMYNNNSSPVIIGTVFRNNRAENGGGMLNNNNGQLGPLIVNSIFSGNTLSGTGRGTNIAMDLGNTGAETIRIAGSVLGIGLAQPTNDIVGFVSSGGSAALNITYHSLANGVVNFGADANLTINGMNFTYPTITTGSSAINLGLFVRRNGRTYYFSEDEATWYTGFTSTGAGGLVTVDTPPANATDLTATDIAGNARSGRPDAGVHEVR